MTTQSGFKLFVGDLPPNISEEELNTVFSNYGLVHHVQIMPPNARSNNRCALLFYAERKAAEDAITVLNGKYKIRHDAEHPIKVSWARERGAPVPSNGPAIMGGGGYNANGGGGGGGQNGHLQTGNNRNGTGASMGNANFNNGGGGGGGRDYGGKGGNGGRGDQDSYKLFVGGLPTDCRQEEVIHVFQTYGEVSRVHVLAPHAENGRVAAFVYYKTEQAAQDAICVLHDQYKIRLDADHPIQVKWAQSKDKDKDRDRDRERGSSNNNHISNNNNNNGINGVGGYPNNIGRGGKGKEERVGQDRGGKGGRGERGDRGDRVGVALDERGPRERETIGAFNKLKSAEGWKVFVGGLPADITEGELSTVFNTYGPVAKIHTMPVNSQGNVAAFVYYMSESSGDDAIQVLNKKYRIRHDAPEPIQVRWATDKGGKGKAGGGKGGYPGDHGGSEWNEDWPSADGGEDHDEHGDGKWNNGNGRNHNGYNGHNGHNGNSTNGRKLFVGNLPVEICEETLNYVFGTYGTVTSVHILPGKSKSGNACAFVEYSNADEADTAALTLHDKYEIKTGFGKILVRKANSNSNGDRADRS